MYKLKSFTIIIDCWKKQKNRWIIYSFGYSQAVLSIINKTRIPSSNSCHRDFSRVAIIICSTYTTLCKASHCKTYLDFSRWSKQFTFIFTYFILFPFYVRKLFITCLYLRILIQTNWVFVLGIFLRSVTPRHL